MNRTRRSIQPSRPTTWVERRGQHRSPWLLPFVKIEWCLEWAAGALGSWAFLDIVKYLSTFSLLVAVVLSFEESGDRMRQRHYAAWVAINSAQGNGGQRRMHRGAPGAESRSCTSRRARRLHDVLRGVQLANAMLSRCSFQDAELRQSVFRFSDPTYCSLRSANFRNADLTMHSSPAPTARKRISPAQI